MLDQYRVSMYYSTPRRDSGPQPERMQEKHSVNPLMGVIGDWICSKVCDGRKTGFSDMEKLCHHGLVLLKINIAICKKSVNHQESLHI